MRAGRFLQVSPPAEIYLRPASPDGGRVRRARHAAWPAPRPTASATCDLGRVSLLTDVAGAVLLAIRPEQVSVSPGALRRRSSAEVVDVSYFGHDATLRARVCGGETVVIARVPAGGVPAPGSVVCLRVSGDVLAFPDPTAASMTIDQVGHGGRPSIHCWAVVRATSPCVCAVGLGDVRQPGRPRRRAQSRARARRGGWSSWRPGTTSRASSRTSPRSPAGTRSWSLHRGTPTATPSSSDRYQPDVVHASGAPLREVRAGTRHDLHPDLAVLLSTSGSTGSPKLVRLSLANVVANASSIASYLGIRDDRPGDHLPAPALLLRPVRADQPPGQRSRRRAHRAVGRRRLLLGARRRSPAATSFAGVPYTFELLEASGFRERTLPVAAVRHPGGRTDGARSGAGVRRARSSPGLGPVRDVRADRGHRPDGLSPARPGRRRTPRPSASRSRAASLPASDGAGPDGVGELVYAGPNVMMGYAHRARRPGARRRADRAAHRRPGAAAPTTGCGRSWAGSGGRRSCSGCGSTSTGVERLLGERVPPRAGPGARATGCGSSRTGRATVERTRRCVLDADAGCRPRRSAWSGSRACRARPSGKPDYAALTRHAARTRSDESKRSTAATADGDPRPVRRPARPPRRHHPRQLRRPRRRLALVRRGLDAARSGAGDPPAGLATARARGSWRGRAARPRRLTVPTDLSVAAPSGRGDPDPGQPRRHRPAPGRRPRPAGRRGLQPRPLPARRSPAARHASGASCGPRSRWRCRPRCGSVRSPW